VVREIERGWQRQQQRVIQRCHTLPEVGGRLPAALAALREAVPCAVACHGALDPETWLPVGHADDRGSTNVLGALWNNEYLTSDVNKMRLLGQQRRPVGVLSQATGGQLWRSPRYQTILRQIGIEHELRAVLLVGGAAWGYLVLLRPPEMPDFSPAEAALVAAVAPHLAEAQRTDQLAVALAESPGVHRPGLLLLADDDQVVGTTHEADELFQELGYETDGQRLPEIVYLVAAAARAAAHGTLQAGVVPRGRLRTPAGQWPVVHGSLVRTSDSTNQVAITIEPARTSEVASLLVKAYEFTDREQQVSLLVLQGMATEEIARRLCVSPYTVQDHLKAIFDKAGVRSRRELVAEVFYRHQRP
jgi:DNA-binding CsgD family transcriptional regulator